MRPPLRSNRGICLVGCRTPGSRSKEQVRCQHNLAYGVWCSTFSHAASTPNNSALMLRSASSPRRRQASRSIARDAELAAILRDACRRRGDGKLFRMRVESVHPQWVGTPVVNSTSRFLLIGMCSGVRAIDRCGASRLADAIVIERFAQRPASRPTTTKCRDRRLARIRDATGYLFCAPRHQFAEIPRRAV